MGDEQIRQTVRLESLEPMRWSILFLTSMHPAVELAVVVFVTNPFVKTATPLRRNHVKRGTARAFPKTIHMPLADPGRVVAGILEGARDGGLVAGKRQLMLGDAPVRIHTSKQRSAKRAAQRIARHAAPGPGEPGGCKVIQVGRAHIAVARIAGGVVSVLITQQPDEVERRVRFHNFGEPKNASRMFPV
jgi:hypothetical protein